MNIEKFRKELVYSILKDMDNKIQYTINFKIVYQSYPEIKRILRNSINSNFSKIINNMEGIKNGKRKTDKCK
jgi:hypothetical protein